MLADPKVARLAQFGEVEYFLVPRFCEQGMWDLASMPPGQTYMAVIFSGTLDACAEKATEYGYRLALPLVKMS